jgi:hypothetical protein
VKPGTSLSLGTDDGGGTASNRRRGTLARLIVAGVMAPADDIKGETTASEAAGSPTETGPRLVGPEGKNGGQAEAPDAPLTDHRNRGFTPDGMPGQRADLPEGSHRDPIWDPKATSTERGHRKPPRRLSQLRR